MNDDDPNDPMTRAVDEAVRILDAVPGEEAWQAAVVVVVVLAHRRDVPLKYLLENIISLACGDEPAPGPRLRAIDGGKP